MIILNYRSTCCITEDFEVKLTLEILTVRGQQHSFSTREWMFLCKGQSFWDRKCLDLWGTTRTPQPSDSCRMLSPFELSEPDICCSMFFNTGSGGIDIFEVKLKLEMLTVRGKQHSFSTHERMFLWKCQKRQNDRHFADTFKRISLNENVRISNEILVRWNITEVCSKVSNQQYSDWLTWYIEPSVRWSVWCLDFRASFY